VLIFLPSQPCSRHPVSSPIQYREASIQIPFYLNAISKKGDIVIQLPRSFVGFLSVIGSNGNIHFSDSVSEQVGSLSETDTSRQCFVGDLTEFGDPTEMEGRWKGDEVALSAESGSITVQHVDNDPSSVSTSIVPPTIGLQNVFVSLDTHSFTFSRG
jgi:hypothetical protein